MKSISRQLRILGTLLGVLAIAGCGAAPADTSSAGTGANMGAGAGGAAGSMITTTAGASGASGIGGASGTTAGSAGTSVPVAGMSAGAAGDVSGAAGVSSTAGTGGELMCGDGAPKEGMCKDKAEGIYAIKVEIDVWWKAAARSIKRRASARAPRSYASATSVNRSPATRSAPPPSPLFETSLFLVRVRFGCESERARRKNRNNTSCIVRILPRT